jgi:hypothetical protein
VFLVTLWVVLVAGVLEKSPTSDEPVHILGGYVRWALGDERVNPENGVLPQRLAALPLMVSRPVLPSRERPAWKASDEWALAYQFLYDVGNDADGVVLAARASVALLAVALAALVFAWSRRRYGPWGGWLSLVVCGTSPVVLGHGALATSDVAGALFFLVSAWALGRLADRVGASTVAVAGLAVGGLALSKLSAPLVVPVALVVLGVRALDPTPLPVTWRGRDNVEGVAARARVLGVALAGVLGVAWAVVWLGYGLRFPMLTPSPGGGDVPSVAWGTLLGGPGLTSWVLGWARDHAVLPEAYLFGTAHVLQASASRPAFLNGAWSEQGWWWFFPYAFLVKTPLPTLVILGVAAGRARGWDWARVRAVAPLAALVGVHAVTVVTSHLNIGHRHLLPVYAGLFVLAGAAVASSRRVAWVLGACVALLVVEAGARWPHHLAYFNQLVGGPSQGYRHLVDSSLDWGQDLPGVRRYLDQRAGNRPAYLSYFGNGSPDHAGIAATLLPGSPGWDEMKRPPVLSLSVPREKEAPLPPGYDVLGREGEGPTTLHLVKRPEALALRGGTYLVSATILQGVPMRVRGPWTPEHERAYRLARDTVWPLLHDGDVGSRAEVFARARPEAWRQMLEAYLDLRWGRACAWLRQNATPTTSVGHSILVYDLTDEQVRAALDGPPPGGEAALP